MTATRPQIVAWIADTLPELHLTASADQVDETTGLLGRGIGLDSMEVLQLVVAAEERFDLTVDESQLRPEYFRTVGAFATFLQERMSAT
jgi:acyl carrier protein